MELNIDFIKAIIDEVDRSGLSTLKLETEGFKLSVEKAQPMQVVSTPVAVPAAPAAAEPAADVQPAQADVCGNVVTSPIVGTFYASASPEKPAYVKVGQRVQKGDVLFIVESMKLMNEITSEYDGTVEEIYVRDGQSLEYGQPVLRIV
ncbi:acetyl-CoA carboxylase biotin carboxyl carrier protein [Ethanoligenens harbinense]|uniref:Biotin carboxyl carrier protein of acetyl-CoA carboxylase n=1 Tax=Ethanoligenens harbinense (strain DSM 18485 / JCM 12961 / CGMCC 1.5033 / YUAN-3) TaxID=663278 RepID=E6U771_ETHHY|nr:acetyl-CoA carboxylase biotin carboxyl carrier protein [Ethanoligenens harbinense]ADU28141.1 acetyl-CoA carboxylase, biotin carboxyl carrier protein [Ethanoligenens harbinense YUAN-3]AVQ97145.1 acetyl-CoA carboxylase biotin carboxyl carrier protein [Ethanoligenens harbinense YUAN-3]AYF39808.1 acetyl-CoA carboxylase biotin carboxyl carrier protein [Ethanoligenens harbinense]AYF42640.1 acetyl-CoA carboxylase biotin carboxyl carrier protein [Ethanoligenens harbinense]QCN93389.1 acetyl-CoA carb